MLVVKIGYLTNQYPKISHTFIRREILSLEELGCSISRFSIRGAPEELTDPADISEVERTKILLQAGKGALLSAVSRVAAKRPKQFLRAVALAAQLSRISEKNAVVQAAYLAEACLLLEWCQAQEITHLHVHFGTNPVTVALLCAELGGPSYSFTVHGPEEFDKADLIQLSTKIKNAKFVAGISEFGRSQLYRQVPFSEWKKVKIVRCGVDQRYLASPPSLSQYPRRLVCVGRLSEQKGQMILLEAAAKLHLEGVAFELVLVGDGELRAPLETFIAEHGLSKHVEITGWASGEEVRKNLEASRALVLPSFAEGLPVVIMEALARARPVLSTYVAGIPELVLPGTSGWLVPAGSVDQLAAAMKVVLDETPEELARLGEEGRTLVLARHDAKENAKYLLACFHQFVG